MSNITELRTNPIQERSARRLKQLEDAAREAINTIGRDAFTTADVAAIAGASIGTVYRYFPDRIAILNRVWPNRDAHLADDFELDESAMSNEADDEREAVSA